MAENKNEKWDRIFNVLSGEKLEHANNVKDNSNEQINNEDTVTDTNTGWIDITPPDTIDIKVYGLKKDDIFTEHILMIIPIPATPDNKGYYHVVHEVKDSGEVFGGYKILTHERLIELFGIDYNRADNLAKNLYSEDIIDQLASYLYKHRKLIDADTPKDEGVKKFNDIIIGFFEDLANGML